MVTRRRMLMVPPAAAAAAVVSRDRARGGRAPAGPGARARARPPRAVAPRAVRHLRAQPAGRAQHVPADGARRRGAADVRSRRGALLPEPFWDGHASAIDVHLKAWKLAFANLRRPEPASGFVARFIDPAFNDCIFLWDSCFMTLFGRYGARAFPFVRTLDNFYAKQHPDGFICREIGRALGDDRFPRFDPSSTGPNVHGVGRMGALPQLRRSRSAGARVPGPARVPPVAARVPDLAGRRLLVDGLGMRDGQPAAPPHAARPTPTRSTTTGA